MQLWVLHGQCLVAFAQKKVRVVVLVWCGACCLRDCDWSSPGFVAFGFVAPHTVSNNNLLQDMAALKRFCTSCTGKFVNAVADGNDDDPSFIILGLDSAGKTTLLYQLFLLVSLHMFARKAIC